MRSVPALALFSLLGCSLLDPADHTESLTIESNGDTTVSCTLSQVQSRPFVYQCGIPEADKPETKVFATVVRDCTIPEKFTVQATTRQLFVGLTELSVLKQSGIDLDGSRALLSIVKAQLDATEVSLVTVTRREAASGGEACISDLVVWRPWDESVGLDVLESTAISLAKSSHFAAPRL